MSSIARIGDFFGLVFLFSLITLIFKKYFSYWLQFAKWAMPLCIAAIVILNMRLHHSPGGFMNMDDLFDPAILFLIYGFFIAGSLMQLMRAYREKR